MRPYDDVLVLFYCDSVSTQGGMRTNEYVIVLAQFDLCAISNNHVICRDFMRGSLLSRC